MASPRGLLMLLSLFLIMFSGVRWQVLRKKRTSFATSTHVEDSEFGNSTRYRVIAGAETTGGEYFVMEALVRPGAYGVWRGAGPGGGGGLSSAPAPFANQRPGSEPPHSHAFQTEVVIVKSGMLGFWKGPRAGDEDSGSVGEAGQQRPAVRARPASAPGRGRTGVVGPGDAIVFAAGEPHAWWNAGVTDPNAAEETANKPKEAPTPTKDDKKKKKKKKGGAADEDDAAAQAPAPPAATTADPGELLVQVVTWPAGPAGERLYENLAGLGHDYGSPLAVGPAQRALTYSRAASRLETVTPEGWASMEAWALPALEILGYKGLYPKYRSDLARATDLDAAAQAYAEARAAHESGGADAEGEGDGKARVRGSGLRAELIAATMQGKEARRAKLEEIARRRRAAQQQREQEGGEGGEGGAGGEAEVPPRRRQWHAGDEEKGPAGGKGAAADGEMEERREEERRRREEAQARRRRRDDEEEEEEEAGKDEL